MLIDYANGAQVKKFTLTIKSICHTPVAKIRTFYQNDYCHWNYIHFWYYIVSHGGENYRCPHWTILLVLPLAISEV